VSWDESSVFLLAVPQTVLAVAQVWEATPSSGEAPFLDTLWGALDEVSSRHQQPFSHLMAHTSSQTARKPHPHPHPRPAPPTPPTLHPHPKPPNPTPHPTPQGHRPQTLRRLQLQVRQRDRPLWRGRQRLGLQLLFLQPRAEAHPVRVVQGGAKGGGGERGAAAGGVAGGGWLGVGWVGGDLRWHVRVLAGAVFHSRSTPPPPPIDTTWCRVPLYNPPEFQCTAPHQQAQCTTQRVPNATRPPKTRYPPDKPWQSQQVAEDEESDEYGKYNSDNEDDGGEGVPRRKPTDYGMANEMDL